MSFLATALTDLMARRGMKNVELANKTGIDPATITRWKNGEQVSITDEDLVKVAEALSDEPREQAEVVAARMKDVCLGPGSQLIELHISGSPEMRNSAGPYIVPLPPKVERAFEILREAVTKDKATRDTLIGLANILSKGDPSD